MDFAKLAGFIVAFVLLSYATGWVNKGLDWLFAALWHLIVRTEHEAIYWLHWKNRAERNGHVPVLPVDCSDDQCVRIDH